MEDFLRMKWTISGPHELEHGPEFVPEERITGSYVFAHLNGTREIRRRKVVASKAAKKTPGETTVPGLNCTFNCSKKSRLSVMQQQKCLNALELLQSGKATFSSLQQNSILFYNNLKQTILSENALFLEYAKQNFTVGRSKVTKANRNCVQQSERAWRQDLARRLDYSQFYVATEMLPYSYTEEDVPIEMLHITNVLELGSVAKFNPPSLMHTYMLNSNLSFAWNHPMVPSKLPVSKDANIDALLQTNSVDIVTSSSVFKKLMDFSNLDCTWCVPVVIKASSKIEGNWVVSKTIFLDKSLRKLKPNAEDLHEYCTKKLLRAKFCSVKAFSFQNEEMLIAQSTKNNSVDLENQRDDTTELEPTANHNVSYRIWNLRQQEEQNTMNKMKHKLREIRILVRCKVDGCEVNDGGMLQPLTVVPKLEYQLEYGGSIPTKTELVKEWTSVYIKPCSQLCRVRTRFKSGEVILIERCSIQKINGEAQAFHDYKPRLGLGALYKLFLELMTNEPGNYLLLHSPKHGPFVQLLKETEQNCPNAFDLHAEYDEKNLEIIPRLQRSWCPVDVNLILPRHRFTKQMPGMFKPSQKQLAVEKSKRKKKKFSKN